ncbi:MULTISPECIES: AAA family ATPase [Leuconostoc]|uniref:Prophage Lp2 protein 17 n=2 Tax=Leuconostoc TaxID=1243 RepID=A0ABM9V483_9LACO|nr:MULTISPECIES: AAA family ATPase [Leuconostoc]MBZ6015423.1 AAA family ATPase [Leuconostoc gelidum subsp. gelidum]CUW12439.1 prophage Lp2 protein 17 [Leuconostoc inhae]
MRVYEPGQIMTMGNMYFIYGEGGTGKTSLAKQLVGNKLLFSFDGSTNALIGTNDIRVFAYDHTDAATLQTQVSAQLNEALMSGVYSTIILDNMTALQNWVLENIDNASKDNRQNYQKLQLWFRDLGMYLRSSGLTVLATAHQIDNGSTGLVGGGRYEADMNAKTFNAFSAPFDVVGRIYKDKGQRYIDLDTEKGNHAKNRIDNRLLIKADELIEEKKEEK